MGESVIAAGGRLSPARLPDSITDRSAAKAISASVPAKQLPGSTSATRLRDVMSTRFSTRLR
jgi:hypothetical protein